MPKAGKKITIPALTVRRPGSLRVVYFVYYEAKKFAFDH